MIGRRDARRIRGVALRTTIVVEAEIGAEDVEAVVRDGVEEVVRRDNRGIRSMSSLSYSVSYLLNIHSNS